MLSYQEIIARRERRRNDEIAFANRRPKVTNDPDVNTLIFIYQAMVDKLFADWRSKMIVEAQATKEVIRPQRARGGRRNNVLAQLGLA
jgi:hypothetical protein